MAARTACLLDAAADGHPHVVVAIRPLYGTTDHLLSSGLLGTQVNWAATPDEDAAGSAATPDR
jgi:methionine-gamma-lyase